MLNWNFCIGKQADRSRLIYAIGTWASVYFKAVAIRIHDICGLASLDHTV